MNENLIAELMSAYILQPMCVLNRKGKIIFANGHMTEVFIYEGIEDSDFFALTGIKTADLFEDTATSGTHILERNGKQFKLVTKQEGEGEEAKLLVYFYDVTNYESLKDRYNDEKICVSRINIENYDELIASTAANNQMGVSTEVDKIIRNWADKIGGSLNKLNNSQYIMYFEYVQAEKLIESKFAILDDVRQIETEADFPVSLSIGIGIGGKSLVATDEYASAALDLALGRGGDQAVVKRVNKIEYYGGKMQTVEKGNKGKSRVVAHALKQLIEQSKRVIIMGHINPDMDCFGAALGIHRMCAMSNRDSYIVINEVNDSLDRIYRQAKETQNYQFINSKKAESIIDKDTLVVLVDTHRPSYAEDGGLLKMTDKIVVIDHHRRAEDAVENPTLSYIESYASSTCELISEILQYAAPKKTLIKLEAEALLGGITIDTN